MADRDFSLAEAIELVRSELHRAQDLGHRDDVRFAVGSVELEFAVEVTGKAGADASIRVLNVFSLGAHGEASKGETNRVKVTLNPIGVNGEPFEVGSHKNRRRG